MALFTDNVSQIDQGTEIIDGMQLNWYEKALKKMIEYPDVKSYYRSKQGIGRGHEVQHAKEDAGRDEAPFGLKHPPEEQFLGKAGPERDQADIDHGCRGEDGLDLTPHYPSYGA